MKALHRILPLACLLGSATGTHAAVVALGDKIGIDLGPSTTTNWNNITTNNAGVAAGSVSNLAGTIMDGVSITTSNAQFTNNDGTNNWVGLSTNGGSAPVEFVDSVTTDIAGNYSLGDGSPYTITLSGLDDSFTYSLVAVTTAGYAPIDTVTVNGGTPSAISRPDSQASGLFHSFSGLTTDGSGNITIKVVDTSATSNPILNGALLTVTAIPETSTMVSVILSAVFLGFRRRRQASKLLF